MLANSQLRHIYGEQLTSADLGLEKDFLVGVRLEKGDPGEKV